MCIRDRVNGRGKINAETLQQREVKCAHGEIAPVRIEGGRAADHPTLSKRFLDQERVTRFESRKNGGRRMCGARGCFIDLKPGAHLRASERAVAWIIKQLEGGVFETLRDDARGGTTGIRLAREWSQ